MSQQKNTGLWVTLIILSIVCLISIFVNYIGFSAGLLGDLSNPIDNSGPESKMSDLSTVWVEGYGDTVVASIQIYGPIMREAESGFIFPKANMVDQAIREIKAATQNPNVSAIILRIDSPGGAVTACDEIYHELMRFKEADPDRKIIAFVEGLAASGGYYLAVAADTIIATPTAIVGSVGVIMQGYNFSGLSQKIGITDVTIKSGANKDLLNPMQPLNPEHLASLQALVDDSYARFVELVKKTRPIKTNVLLDGSIYSASFSLEESLIDGIGYWENAIESTCALLETDDIHLIRYETQTHWSQIFSEMQTPVNLELISPLKSPKMLYMWRP